MNILKIVLFFVFAIILVNVGLDKFFHYLPHPEVTENEKNPFNIFLKIPWIMPLIGTIEVLSGIFILFPKTRTVGAILIFPIIIGVLIHNLSNDSSNAVSSIIFFCINIWILLENKEKIEILFS